MLPDPTVTFTVPSIHDSIDLECRIYHPEAAHSVGSSGQVWQKRGAIVAHPYAPLGGCFDDPVVDLIGGQLLEQEYVVGTFNFR